MVCKRYEGNGEGWPCRTRPSIRLWLGTTIALKDGTEKNRWSRSSMTDWLFQVFLFPLSGSVMIVGTFQWSHGAASSSCRAWVWLMLARIKPASSWPHLSVMPGAGIFIGWLSLRISGVPLYFGLSPTLCRESTWFKSDEIDNGWRMSTPLSRCRAWGWLFCCNFNGDAVDWSRLDFPFFTALRWSLRSSKVHLMPCLIHCTQAWPSESSFALHCKF